MKDKSLEEIKLGEQAGVVLENPAFINAMQAVKDNIIKAMGTSGLGDEQTHNRLVIALQLLNQIEKQLTDVMQTGKMAAIQTSSKLKIFR
jgi:hypothetical protein